MVGAILSFSSMAIAGRAASAELDTFEMMTWRSFVGLVLVLAIGGVAGTLGQITRRNLGLHLRATSPISPARTCGSSPSRSVRWRWSSRWSSPRRSGPWCWPRSSWASG
jgi:uncharacterized MAPEG superfamily protein